MKIGIIGSGKFGVVLAQIASENKNNVLIFSRRENEVKSINEKFESLSGAEFSHPAFLRATSDIEDLNDLDAILVTIPSKDFRDVFNSLCIDSNKVKVVSCTKGFEESTGLLMTEILEKDHKISSKNLLVLSGPNLSKEIGNKELTGTIIAGEDEEFATKLGYALKNSYFIPFYSQDRYGVELGGAMKNIYAIASGYFHEKGVGENTIGFLLTKSLEEMSTYSQARGANPETFLGLSGVGDFVSTALSRDSRNYLFGTYLAKGLSPSDAIQKVGDTVEGYLASKIVFEDAKQKGLDLKILTFINQIFDGPIELEIAKETLIEDITKKTSR
tara:strand:+ start:985 stop:1974 length:990 start_codon:yes stop_codon:yes gene_type:complete